MPQPPVNPTEQAETDKEIWAECAARLKLAEEIESPNRLLAIEDLEFADGQQWPDDIYNLRKIQRRPTLTINHTATLVRRVCNNMREQRPRIGAHPVSDATVDDARVAKGLIRHVETLSKASVAYDTAGESAVRIGWGYFRIMGEYVDEKSFDQELKIKPIRNALTCYIDPAATLPDGSDMDWFIISTDMKKAAFKRQYPDAVLNEWLMGGPGDEQHKWENKETIRLAEYYRVKYTKDTLYKLSNGASIFRSEYTKNKDAFALAGVMVVKERPTERRQIQWFKINGTKVVEKRDLPGRWIPVVRVEGNVLDLNGEIRRKGMIRDLKDPARSANYWETAKAEKLALSSKAPWIMAEGQADGHPEWDDANQKPYSALKYKLILGMDGNPLPNVPPPMRQPAIEVEAGFAEAAETSMKNLMAVAGMPHEPSQDTPGTVVSGIALRKRQAISDISHFQYYDNQTMAIAHCGTILLDLFPFYYGEQRIQRIIGDDGTPEMVGINTPKKDPSTGVVAIAHNMQVGRYDVVMDTGPGYETKRQEQAELTVDLLKIGPLAEVATKAGADLIFRNFEMDEMADRLVASNPQGLQKAIEQLPEQAQNIVKAIQGELQQTQQALQHAQLELKYKSQIEQGWMRTELTKTEMQTHVKAHDVDKRDMAAERDTQTKAQASIAVAEIGAAGKLLDTHVHGKYDAEGRKEEIAAAEKAEKNKPANGAS